MASEFTDISGNTPLKTNDKQPKKRSGLTGRMRLLPLTETSAQGAYEMYTSNNSGNAMNGTKSGLVTQKLKKITHKRELMEAVRKASTPIMLPGRDSGLSSSNRSLHDGNGSNSTSDTDSGQRDIEYLEDGVHHNARKFNELKLMVDRRQRELHKLLDELRVLQLENETLSKIQNQDTPVSKKNNQIKQHIAQCTASMEEQMHLRRQLEHMIRRLQTTQLRVDAQLTGMAAAVDSSEREAEEVKMLCRQLEVGKSRAVQFLQEVQLQLQVERKARARELGDHEVRARNSQKMETWRLQRAQERAEMVAEMRGDLSAEEEARLLKCIENRERDKEALHAANLVKSQKNADFEAVLAEMKLAMGASNLREVVEKIGAQAATSVSLDKEKTQAEERLVAVRQEKEQVLRELNELKASGIGGIELNREVYNTLESEIQQAKATLKVNKSAYGRLDGVMSAVRQGSFGLARRLQAFDDVLETGTGENAGTSTVTGSSGSGMIPTNSMLQLMSGGEHAGYLITAELKLTKILEIVGQSSSSVNTFGGYDGSGVDNGNAADENSLGNNPEDGGNNSHLELLEDGHTMWSPTTNNDPRLHENNIRVRPSTRALPSASLMAARIGITLPVSDDEPDSARSEASATGSDIGEQMSVLVPSRDILKMSSSRHFAEVMRKKELAEKQKVAAEKGISDEEMMAKLRKRNQLETDARLATSPTRHGPELFFAKAAAVAKDNEVPGSSINQSQPLAFVTQMHFNDL
ncbi:hypothetical protein F441_17456 [Phytophthora nicotianae CJ01A1]|uniref:Uncharacterized protein n=5 Tax=Phytophthora nicotianae TaxID=4792 RepID=V9EAS7_PHYNI|nr:hypothetical protein F443_17586 [Phytophthora nicotianae P1569]ETK76473.1 hypothetical protein L915_17123 [Phytophthora nicotianae]ETP06071.1 hypothetical protein F441_17456 [Phytophthora nicotianae CJ01A1]ETP34180.1 hypothetical protein F442_17443 [Phytophthora nicotianae P10297]ETL29911.1 hypothetical protein L916_17018 [Phytophthora nicotianae]